MERGRSNASQSEAAPKPSTSIFQISTESSAPLHFHMTAPALLRSQRSSIPLPIEPRNVLPSLIRHRHRPPHLNCSSQPYLSTPDRCTAVACGSALTAIPSYMQQEKMAFGSCGHSL